MDNSTPSQVDEYDLTVSRNRGLGQLLFDQVQKRPDSISIIDGHHSLTYRQLHFRASHLAQQLLQLSLDVEEPVGILGQHSAASIIAQVAIIYAGGTCVPINPDLPDSMNCTTLERVGARFIVADEESIKDRNVRPFYILVVPELDEQITGPTSLAVVPTDLDHRSHILHTSGTTSTPKPVQIMARNILHLSHYCPFEPLRSDDVVGHGSMSTFDASLFATWAPLLRGATIAVLSKEVMLDPYALAEDIDRHGITVIFLITAIANLVASTYPSAVKKLRICIFGGEAANPVAMGNILRHGPPGMLVNGYGPTECCVYCLVHPVTLDDIEAGSIPIGKPFGRNTVRIVDSAGRDSDDGELWVGGPCVSRSYLDEPEKNATRFTTFEDDRFYHTGDIVKRLPNGDISYVGRVDRQVKIRGYRIELEAVESALLATGEYSEVAAMKIDPPQEGAGSILVAYVVPASASVDAGATTKRLKEVLPEYMVPHIQIIAKMPLNANAKVDVKKLTQLYHERWNTAVCGKDQLREKAKTTSSKLAQIWTDILGLDATSDPMDVNTGDRDFFSMGGTSLLAALLLSRIKRTFGINVTLATLFNNPTLHALSAIIENHHTYDPESQLKTSVRTEREIWEADLTLADDLTLPDTPLVDWTSETEGRVFLTGATGFLGAFLLADLLRLPHVQQVACLVRAQDAASALNRIQATLTKYNLWQDSFISKLLPFPGRLEDPFLGLTQSGFNHLANWSSIIFHLAAVVNYTQPYSKHRASNTLGTLNILRLATTGARTKPLHYTSSIGCFGPTGYVTGTTSISEDSPDLDRHAAALLHDNGYSQSQWVVEKLLAGLMGRGFPIAIYRPGFITGHSRSGVCNPDDFFNRLALACLEMGCYPKLPRQRKEFVPVDYVCKMILHIASSSAAGGTSTKSLGHAFHIVPPEGNSIGMDETMELVGACVGERMEGVSYGEWVDRVARDPPERLQALLPMLEEKMWRERTRWELHEGMPVYRSDNTRKVLESYPGGLEFPGMEAGMMRRYLDFLRGKNSG